MGARQIASKGNVECRSAVSYILELAMDSNVRIISSGDETTKEERLMLERSRKLISIEK